MTVESLKLKAREITPKELFLIINCGRLPFRELEGGGGWGGGITYDSFFSDLNMAM